MSLVTLASPETERCSAWQAQIGRNRGQRLQHGPRPFAALFYHYRGHLHDGLIELRRLRIDVLHDLPNDGAPLSHRLARYTAGLVADGVMLGGASRIQFEKNLGVAPGRESRGRQIGARDTMLLQSALEIDRYLDRHSRFPNYPRRTIPRLPQLWVSLALQHPTGSGDQFERFCRDTGWPLDLALTSVRHLHGGDWLYPLDYVQHHALHIRGVFADMGAVPKRQVIHFEHPENLISSAGTCRYDFWNCRFRSGPF